MQAVSQVPPVILGCRRVRQRESAEARLSSQGKERADGGKAKPQGERKADRSLLRLPA